MTPEEAIEMYTRYAEYERTHGNLQGCLEFRQLAEWLKELKIVSNALSNVTNWEGCDYGYAKACDIADKYAESEDKEV